MFETRLPRAAILPSAPPVTWSARRARQNGNRWEPYFKPYLIHLFVKGGSGADVGHLKTDANILAGLRPDSQRYFDYHHAANDTFDKINKRELELGSATMAALVYLIDFFSL